MKYELAKRLKNAGYPLKEVKSPMGSLNLMIDEVEGIKHYEVPTLEELIEACGEGFVFLERDTVSPTEEDRTWFASTFNDVGCVGRTPSEAVSKLWLKLYENTTPMACPLCGDEDDKNKSYVGTDAYQGFSVPLFFCWRCRSTYEDRDFGKEKIEINAYKPPRW